LLDNSKEEATDTKGLLNVLLKPGFDKTKPLENISIHT
jgi:hypothetical protein